MIKDNGLYYDINELLEILCPPPHELPPLAFIHLDSEGQTLCRAAIAVENGQPPAYQGHLDYFRKKPFPNSGPQKCPEGCCLGRPVAGNGCLVLSGAGLADKKNISVLKLLLSSLAREIEHAALVKELKEKVDFGQMIVHSMSSGFMVLRPDLRVLNANPAACRLLQTTEDKLVGAKLSDFILSKLVVKQVFATGKAVKDQEVFIKLPNRDLHILKTAVPVFDNDGSVIAVLDHFREIKEAHRLISRMAGARASFTFSDIIHRSRAMGEAIELSKMAAGNSLSVLITGESGTGKELFAHAIHMASQRRNGPFVVIDCASMPRELVASELFGYMEGAFTGARKGGMPGKFELADGGTIFMDELGELPLEIQAQFLRVLQNRQVMRLGGKDMLPVDIRVIAATNRDLVQEVNRGNFREDLYYRLNVLAVNVPGLRSRPEDVAELAEYFLHKYCRIIGKSGVGFSEAALSALKNYHWPGNVRELENAVAKAVHICDRAIEPAHLRLPAGTLINPRAGASFLNSERPEQLQPPLNHQPPTSFKDMEMRLFQEAIAACEGNISRAAKKLGVARSTIYKKMATWQ